MVSLDDAVLARLEKGGKRYEVLVDPVLVETFKETPNDVDINEFLAMDEVFHDARGGERPTAEAIENVFGTQDIVVIASTILEKGSIQLTTVQRKQMVENMRQQIVHRIHSQSVDPKTKAPHPKTRIELALDESRYSVDPFKRLEEQVKDAVAKLKPLIPLSFETVRLAFKVPGSAYGSVSQLLRTLQQKEGWLEDGSWACVIECPAGMKGEIIGQVMRRSSDAEVKELS
ncbi:MAG: ribosome assembly factor SBDS [Candidatus Poseidonia sp.]|nr:ribosome assembly factor SBDS [Poseidonia sp.]MEC7058721.1 ribosome assembly factor SBDS [Candidatus Thermoplasmatota archaeon]MEC7089596.1 ribosome assembly factor SBDS [Candidatus Thermoplasmatota archaeon]MEC8708062.1 ribosome assembly factor SBDS [Candidatus Thermoplasmatota archaeon]DAC59331.1 MAG TPA: ribosome assembly factor SBDS [Candidatus Poseidoniales archaeon]